MHVNDVEARTWLQNKLESRVTQGFNKEEQLKFLEELTAADGLERYLGRNSRVQNVFLRRK